MIVCAVPEVEIKLTALVAALDNVTVTPEFNLKGMFPAAAVPSPILNVMAFQVMVPPQLLVPLVVSKPLHTEPESIVTLPESSSAMQLSAAVGGPELSTPEALTLDQVLAVFQFPPEVFKYSVAIYYGTTIATAATSIAS